MADHFPQEILVEILHRLPPKSIVRCTAVCKSWFNLITNPSFIYHHLHHSPSPNFLILPFCDTHDTIRYSLRHDDPLLSDTFSILHLPPSFNSEFSVASITHGLVLCLDPGSLLFDSFYICNPSLRRFLTLPKPRIPPFFKYNAAVGFGFDSRNLDYKVVRIASLVDHENFGLCAPHVDVYSLASGDWKDVSDSAPVCSLCFSSRDALHGHINGIVHWAVKRKVGEGWYYFVLSFCFEDEVFGEVLLPQGLVCESFDDDVAVVGGGKDLTVYHGSGFPTFRGDIWVMKEYGVVESWNKVFSFNWTLGEFCFEAPLLGIMLYGVMNPPDALCVTSCGEVLFVLDDLEDEHLYLLDVESETFINLQIGMKRYTWYMYAGYYKESLVLLNKASGLMSY